MLSYIQRIYDRVHSLEQAAPAVTGAGADAESPLRPKTGLEVGLAEAEVARSAIEKRVVANIARRERRSRSSWLSDNYEEEQDIAHGGPFIAERRERGPIVRLVGVWK